MQKLSHFSCGFMKKFMIFRKTQFVLLIISISCGTVYGQDFNYFKIKNAYFVKDSPITRRKGYNYGIKVEIIADSSKFIENGNLKKNLLKFEIQSISSPNIIQKITETGDKFKIDANDSSLILITSYLLGPFDPSVANIITVHGFGETRKAKIEFLSISKDEMSSKEKIDSYISNKFDIDFNIGNITNFVNEFATDIKLEFLDISNFDVKINGTLATSDTLKNGLNINIDIYSLFGFIEKNLGGLFGKQYYRYKFDLGFYLETDQKWKTKKMHIKVNPIFEIPFTNILSLKTHREYNILRSAPGMFVSISYLYRINKSEDDTFSKKQRLDISAWYNLTFSPILFAKLKTKWFLDPDNRSWKSFQEHQFGLKINENAGFYYFLKYVKGFYPPDFINSVDEYSIGISTSF
ncbi:hypothetical protein ACFL4T_02975 [candidate division KSB1 bacterium]